MPTFTPGRIVSGLLAILIVGAAVSTRGVGAGLKIALGCCIPLACIWFPTFIGSYTAAFHGGRPASNGLVQLFGWVILVLPILFALFVGLSR